MDMSEYADIFKDEVRAMVSWPLLVERCRASLEIVATREELGRLETVWHRLPDGRLTSWSDQQGSRETVSGAAKDVAFLPEVSVRYIRTIEREFAEGRHPRVWGIPVYLTDSGRTIILDGNHRLTALHLSHAPVRLIAVQAQGYDDATLLPDLLHDTGKDLPPHQWKRRVEEIERAWLPRTPSRPRSTSS